MYINRADSDDLYFIWTTLRYYNGHTHIIIIISQPFETLLSGIHLIALTPIVLGCPSANGMHDANSSTIHITHANIYNMIYIYII